jgi:hypothetical protein
MTTILRSKILTSGIVLCLFAIVPSLLTLAAASSTPDILPGRA